MVDGGLDRNPTPTDINDTSDEIEGCVNFWYPGIGTRDGMGCVNDPTVYAMEAVARSRHTAGINAALCDGSVRFISNSISLTTWRALGSSQGGEVLGSDY